jgi:hypothetical protein
MVWRAKLYAGLLIGFGVVLAGWTVLTAMSELKYEYGQDYDDALAGIGLFVTIALVSIVLGFTRIKRARQLAQIALRAQLQPEADWIVLGREVRSTDPTGTAGPPLTFTVSGRTREELVRGAVRQS